MMNEFLGYFKGKSRSKSMKGDVSSVEEEGASTSKSHIDAVETSRGMANIFASLNKGEGITQGLTHLTPEEKARRRAAAKQSGGKVGSTPTKASSYATPKKAPSLKPKKAPLFELVAGREWICENITKEDGNKTIEDIDFKQTVTIRDCNDATFIINKKCSSILIDSCKKVNVVFNGVISGLEIIRSDNIKTQVLSGSCMNFTLDSVSCATYYLNACSRTATFTATAITSNNIVFPAIGQEEEEYPDTVTKSLPEQFQHVLSEVEDNLHTRVSDVYLED